METRKNSDSIEIKSVEVSHRPTAPTEYALAKSFSPENYRNFEFNGKLYSSVWPERIELLSPDEQEDLKNAPWFQAGLQRKISLEILLQQSPGAFLIRHSESHKKCFVLSLRTEPVQPPKLLHYLIEKNWRGYAIKGFSKEFSSLKSLVIHHSVLKEQLPIPLALPRSHVKQQNLIIHDEERDVVNEVMKSPTTLCFKKKSKDK